MSAGNQLCRSRKEAGSGKHLTKSSEGFQFIINAWRALGYQINVTNHDM